MANTTVALLALAGGAALAYTAIKDPPGGILGAFGNVLSGRPQVAGTVAATAADAVAFAPAFLSSGAAGSAGTAAGASFAGSGGGGAAALAYARQYDGTPYRYGGSSPATGFDCSGLVQWCYRHALGISLPRTAAAQQQVGFEVGLAAAQPGDLLFFGAPAHHVAFYVSPGQMYAAPHTGDHVRQEAIYAAPSNVKRVSGLKKSATVAA